MLPTRFFNKSQFKPTFNNNNLLNPTTKRLLSYKSSFSHTKYTMSSNPTNANTTNNSPKRYFTSNPNDKATGTLK